LDSPYPDSPALMFLPKYYLSRTKAGPPVLFLYYYCTAPVLISAETVQRECLNSAFNMEMI